MSIQSLLVNSLMASLEVSMLVTDARGRVQWCNKGFTALSGFDLEELRDRKPGQLLQCEETDPKAIARVSRHLRAGLPVVEELLNRRRDGARYWTRMQILPIHGESGQVEGFMSLQQDVTGEMRRRLRASQVFEDQLLSAFSHEVRTPLNAVCNLIDLLRLEMGDPPEGAQRLLDLTTHASDSLLRLVDDVLDVARLKAGRFSSRPTQVRLSRVMARVAQELATHPVQPSVSLEVVSSPQDPLLVMDASLVHRLLVNLAGNALKFTERGRVEVRVEINPALSLDSSVGLRFSVTDTGIGIEPGEVDRLLLPFEQGEPGATTRVAGVGLGLALCEQMLRALGSRLQVTSRLGSGSCFWFEIQADTLEGPSDTGQDPCAPPGHPASTGLDLSGLPEKTPRGPLTGLRLLLVDDNPLGLSVASRQLERSGAQVTAVSGGMGALQALTASPRYDLVLMDLHMPRPDGFETTRMLRELPGCQALPVVALSAGVAEVEREAALAVSMSGFIDKPFTLQTLVEGIRAALGREDPA